MKEGRTFPDLLRRYLPILTWGAEYSSRTLASDLVAAVIVSIMLIPQSLAYALMVGLPPQVGLYASMAPLALYAIFGTSRALAVGPVAVASLMTGAAAGQVAAQGTPEHLGAAIAIAAVAGILLIAMGVLRLGFLANFLSHPVISGFITAAAVQISAGQVGPLLGIRSKGENLLDILQSMVPSLFQINPYTAAIGLASLSLSPVGAPRPQSPPAPLRARRTARGHPGEGGPRDDHRRDHRGRLGLRARRARRRHPRRGAAGSALARPAAVRGGALDEAVVPALLICIVGYVESISVALTLAAKRRQRVDPDQELIALGVSEVGAAVSGGFPVAGALSRSVVNFDAGAQTPAAGAFTAVGVALATLFLTPLLFFLPKAVLGAIIISAVLSLVDLGALKHTWAYSRADFAAMAGTILLTWLEGVEAGLVLGVALSIFLHLYATSRPHVAVVGQIPGTAHFRNVARHAVVTDPEILSLRVDESLYFPNARFIEELVNDAVAANPAIRHIILECPAVNTIDASALESLEAINRRLKDGGVTFHLSEVKGPVMDRLKRSHFLQELTGKVHLSQFDAVSSIKPDLARRTRDARREDGPA